MLFAEKKGGRALRLCVDYHALNANTVIDAWPLPYIDNLLSQLKVARVFSSLDLYDIIIRYQLILLIDVKWRLHIAMGSMNIQFCFLGLRMHQLIFNVM